MSLNWNVEKIVNYKQVCWIEADEQNEDGTPKVRLNPVTEALVFNSMVIDIGEITHDNAGEVFARTKILERLNGALLTKGGKEAWITSEDIEAHIGLSVNVSFKNRADWAKRWFVSNGDYLMKYGTKFNKAKFDKDETNFDVTFDNSLTGEFRRQFNHDRDKRNKELADMILGHKTEK